VRCPFAILYGTADDRVIPEDTLSIYDSAPSGTMIVAIEGAHHFFWEQPKQLAEISEKVSSFFSEAFRQAKEA
jgi:pimeloyl-ACP methyl ester carboxylesterase